MADPWQEALAAASAIAREAGALIRSRFDAPRRIGTKSRAIDLVTDTDQAADRLIGERLAAAFPEHGRITEEGGVVAPGRGGAAGAGPAGGGGAGASRTDAETVHWIVDPLDGTTNFAHGFPQFAVSIAAVVGLDPRDPLAAGAARDRARTVVGVVYDPMRDELFAASENGPATLDGRPIRVSAERALGSCLFSTGFPYDRRERADYYLAFWREMMLACRDVRRVGAAALDLAWVACGRIDGFWEWNLHAWDVAAGGLIVRRAGGRASDFAAGRDLVVDARQTLATNGLVHDAASAALCAVAARGAGEPSSAGGVAPSGAAADGDPPPRRAP